jgi:hypothetical protein
LNYFNKNFGIFKISRISNKKWKEMRQICFSACFYMSWPR